MNEQSITIKALKLAPWWKRLLAYILDNIFLFIFFVILISSIYGKEFSDLFNNILNNDSFSLMENVDNISKTQLNTLKNLPIDDQKLFYWSYIIRAKYANSIFLLIQIISSVYFGLLWWGTGQTLGARLLKIKVISQNSAKPSVFAIILRVIGLKLIEIGWGLPALIVVNPLFKQRIHDSLSHTVVVEELVYTEEELAQQLEENSLKEEIQKTLSSEDDES